MPACQKEKELLACSLGFTDEEKSYRDLVLASDLRNNAAEAGAGIPLSLLEVLRLVGAVTSATELILNNPGPER